MTEHYSYYRRALEGVSLPAALVDLERFEANLDAMLARAGDLPIRIASKSVRCPALLRHALGHHERVRGLLCFHMREACELAGQGFDDLVVAYPSLQPEDIRAVCRKLREGHRITLMVDSRLHVERIGAIAREEGAEVPLCLEVDLSLRLPGLNFGVYRSPVRTVEDALEVHAATREQEGVHLEGVMGYEAQIAGLGDRLPGARLKSAAIRALKRISVPRLQYRRQQVVEALREAGAELRFVNGGGTGSLESTREDASVTEVAAGSGLYSPLLFDYYDRFHHAPAALFALEVVRSPDSGHVTCLGGGYIASGVPGPERSPAPVYPEGLALDPNEGAGEVQTPLTGPALPAPGEPVFFRHAKAGELCEHFNELHLVRGGTVERIEKTYRGLGWQFV